MTDEHTALITDVWPPIAERWNTHGFSECLFNSHGEDGLLAVEALRQIGASDLADELRSALAALPGGRPAATQDERQAQIDALDPDDQVLEHFDKSLYASDCIVRDLMVAFARQHLAVAPT